MRRADESLHVLGEAGTAVPDAGIDELIPDAVVGADARAHVAHVRPHLLAQRRDLVDERNLGRQHAVGRVFGHFRAAHAHHDELFTAPGKGGIEFAHGGGGFLGSRAHDHAIGFHEIGYRVAFLEEFGIGNHVEGNVRAARGKRRGHQFAHAVGGAHRHGGLVHHDERPAHALADLTGHAFHVGKVAGAVGTGRRAHGDEGEFRVLQAVGKARREPQAARLAVAGHEVFEAGLENMDAPAVQQGHDIGIDVHTADIIAHFGETRRAHKTDVTGADDTYTHKRSLNAIRNGTPRTADARSEHGKRGPIIPFRVTI